MDKIVFNSTVESEVYKLTRKVENTSTDNGPAIILQTADNFSTTKSTDDAIKDKKNKSEEMINCDPETGSCHSDEYDRTRLRATKTSRWAGYGTPSIRIDRLFESPFEMNIYGAQICASLFLIVAIFYLLFGIIEIGLGASVFGYFDNVRSGAWWVGVVLILAVLLQHKVYISYLSALAGCVAAIIGAILDGISSAHFRSITACASQHSDTSGTMYWGNPEHYSLAVTCLSSAVVIVPDGCYCVSTNPKSCNEYTLSSLRTLIKDDCGNIMTTYSMTMTASCVFCVFCFFVALSRIFLLEFTERTCHGPINRS